MQFSTWSFLKLAVVLAMLGVLAGLGFSLLGPTRYIAESTLTLTGADSPEATFQRLLPEVTSRAAVSSIINDPALRLYTEQLRTEPLDDVIDRMRKQDLSITLDPPSKIFIRFVYPDRRKADLAVRILSAYAVQIATTIPVWETKLSEHPQLDVLETASLPTHALRPDARITALAGFAIAFLLALPFRRVRRRIAVVALAGAVMGTAGAWIIASVPAGTQIETFLPLHYESQMTLYAEHASAGVAAEVVSQVLSRDTMASIITDPRLQLYPDQQKKRDLSDIADDMRRDTTVATHHSAFGQTFDISFVYPDRFRAQEVVETIATKMREAYADEPAPTVITPDQRMNWGRLASAGQYTVDAVPSSRRFSVLFGFAIGLVLAATIALVRQRWTPQDEEPFVPQPASPSRFSGAHFRKLAFGLMAAGMVAGGVVAIATPARYVSNASFILRNADRAKAATLVSQALDRAWPGIFRERGLEPVAAHRALRWTETDSGSERFDMRFTSERPQSAYSVLEDLLGAVDHAVTAARAGGDSPYEAIRGVDGALLPIPAEHYGQPAVADSPTSGSQYEMIEGIDGVSVSVPEQYRPAARVISESRPFQAAVPGISRPQEPSIAFDDDRARPVPELSTRIQMEVIDHPNMPSAPEGLGWWSVGIGAAVGLGMALLITVLGRGGEGMVRSSQEHSLT